ncbi:MAG: DUF1489 domain-containing protein [Rhodospirillaceae bacterium]
MIHLIKLAVGIQDIEHLAARQKERLAHAKARGETGRLCHMTRNVPRRAEEVIAGGSIYWVIKGFIRARQRILAIEQVTDEEARKRCAFVLDHELVPTQIRSMRAFQGWRYFEPAQVPADAPGGIKSPEHAEIPDSMAAELRNLGLL